MERNNLWAPWRIKYIKSAAQGDGCFLCDALETPQQDRENLILWRTEHAFVIFNKFPYNNGHLLIAPNRHIPDLSEAGDDELLALMHLVQDCQKALVEAVSPHGFNIGVNIGRCAGAGLPGHVHLHVVPRWNGDTNYMHVCSDTDVISQSLTELYDQLVEISKSENLPTEKVQH